jgi:hypothetical protein
MNMKRTIPAFLILILTAHGSLSAQTFGQFGGAGAATDGEGSVFMLAGNNAFRTGASARFNLSTVSDFGIQLGVDRLCESSFYGGGVDFKVVLLQSRRELPVSLALDASFSGLHASAAGRFIFGFGILASGRVETPSGRLIEPYLSFIVDLEHINDKDASRETAACLCTGGTNDQTNTRSIGRAGVKIPVSAETQILIEANFGDKTLAGAAFNLVF